MIEKSVLENIDPVSFKISRIAIIAVGQCVIISKPIKTLKQE